MQFSDWLTLSLCTFAGVYLSYLYYKELSKGLKPKD